MEKIEKLWKNLSKDEQDVISLGVFPSRLMTEKLSNEESAALIRKSQAKTGVRY